jgi:exoribonuclease II
MMSSMVAACSACDACARQQGGLHESIHFGSNPVSGPTTLFYSAFNDFLETCLSHFDLSNGDAGAGHDRVRLWRRCTGRRTIVA